MSTGRNSRLLIGLFALFGMSVVYHPSATADTSLDQKFHDIANELNTRMNKVDGCGSEPAWTCSGLVMRSTNYLTSKPDATITSHYYIRKDTNTKNLYSESVGIVLESSHANLDSRLQCIYPRDADTVNDLSGYNRSAENYHCSDKNTQSDVNDLSSCKHSLSDRTGDTTDAWYTAFTKHYPDREQEGRKQCSFSVKDPAQFAAAIKASADNHNIIKNNALNASWNELVVKPWGETDMPQIKAVFYANQAGKGFVDADFTVAKKLAEQYQQKTGKAIPVVKIDLVTSRVELTTWRPDNTDTPGKNLLKNDLSDLSITGTGSVDTWPDGSSHDDWTVGSTVLSDKTPVEVLGETNSGLPSRRFHSAVKLAVNNKPGRIYARVHLTEGVNYVIKWTGARDNYQATNLSETDQYTWRIGDSAVETAAYDHQETVVTTTEWKDREYSFTPKKSAEYYLSVRGKARSDGKSRGALLTHVSISVK
ncbi:Uncharacterised protein [Cedecea neteri]|uniref:Uncharacterized protein n=1 Tax=Cedecea neteri TaxID=158822 RepID=A0A291E654_9ENTR|nr:hypothetical protein [Cedecea neteri]ATF95368.1 hypothetical protein CO704_25060 [Cedecea neteri]SQC91978.1 Uncharacterised protein [Cedecea neteri]